MVCSVLWSKFHLLRTLSHDVQKETSQGYTCCSLFSCVSNLSGVIVRWRDRCQLWASKIMWPCRNMFCEQCDVSLFLFVSTVGPVFMLKIKNRLVTTSAWYLEHFLLEKMHRWDYDVLETAPGTLRVWATLTHMPENFKNYWHSRFYKIHVAHDVYTFSSLMQLNGLSNDMGRHWASNWFRLQMLIHPSLVRVDLQINPVHVGRINT